MSELMFNSGVFTAPEGLPPCPECRRPSIDRFAGPWCPACRGWLIAYVKPGGERSLFIRNAVM